jgi:hypothetical protein
MKRSTAPLAALLPLALALTGCVAGSEPSQEGLSPEQCARFESLTEDYLLVYLKDDWRFAAEHPTSALLAVQRVAGEVGDAADELGTPATADAVQRVRDAYRGVVLQADTYLDEPLTVGDPAEVAKQHSVIDAVEASLADCDRPAPSS